MIEIIIQEPQLLCVTSFDGVQEETKKEEMLYSYQNLISNFLKENLIKKAKTIFSFSDI